MPLPSAEPRLPSAHPPQSNTWEDLFGWNPNENEQRRRKELQEKPVLGYFETSIGEALGDIVRAVPAGAVKAVETSAETLWSLGDWLAEKCGGDLGDSEQGFDFVPESWKPKTKWGETAQTITSFLVGWATIGKVFKAGALAQKIGSLGSVGKYVNGALAGATVDFFVDGNTESNFANFLVDSGIVGKDILSYLYAEKDDSILESRAKNALSGIISGGLFDAAWSGMKNLRRVLKETDPLKKLELRGQAFDDLKITLKDIKTHDEALAQTIKEPIATPSVKKAVSEEAEKVLPKASNKAGRVLGLNPNTLNDEAQKVTALINNDIDIAAARATLSNKETYDKATAMLKEFQENFPDSGTSDVVQSMKAMSEAGAQEVKKAMERQKYIALQYEEVLLPELNRLRAVFEIADKEMKPIALDNYERTLAGMVQGGAELCKVRAWFGRALQSVKESANYGTGSITKTVKDNVANTDTILANLKSRFTDDALIELGLGIETMRQGGFTAAQINKELLRFTMPKSGKAPLSTAIDVFNNFTKAYWYNSVLSGPKTHIANLVGNAFNVYVTHPMDTFFSETAQSLSEGAGMLKSVASGAKKSKAYYTGLKDAWTKAVSAMSVAWETGNPILDGSNKLDTIVTHLGKKEQPSLLKKVLSSPTRALTVSDECFKQLAYSGALYEQFFDKIKTDAVTKAVLDRAKKDGVYDKTISEMLLKFLKDSYGNAAVGTGLLAMGGRATNKVALDVAKDLTWQTPITGAWGKALVNIQRGLENLPGGYILLPFVKTPLNIAKDALWEHNPIGILRLLTQVNTPEAKMKIIGQFSSACMMWGIGMAAAKAGLVTGTGPMDRESREFLQENGWQPNSIKINGHYFSIAQCEPACAPFIMMANLYESCRSQPQEDNGILSATAASVFNSIVNYSLDKTYLKQFSNLVRALDGDESKVNTFFKQTVTGFVPSLFNNIQQAVDPQHKLTESLLEAAQARVPVIGSAENIAVKHSWITGNPLVYDYAFGMGPFLPAIKKGKNDIVLDTLSKTRAGVTAPSRTLSGIRLNDTQYAELCKLHGTVRLGGKTLYQALESLFQQRNFKEAGADPAEALLSPEKEELIHRLILRYREAAVTQFNKLHPEIIDAVLTARREAWRKSHGIPPVEEGRTVVPWLTTVAPQ